MSTHWKDVIDTDDEQDVKDVKQDVKDVKQDVKDVKQDVKDVKQDVKTEVKQPCRNCNDRKEYKRVQCRDGNNCRNDDCTFIHEGEDRGCPECRCEVCNDNNRYKTMFCTYYRNCRNGAKCEFMHSDNDRGCQKCGNNRSAASVARAPAPAARAPAPAARAPAPAARAPASAARAPAREQKKSTGPSTWSTVAAAPAPAPAAPAAPAPVVPVPPPKSFTQMAVEKYLKDGSTIVDREGKQHPIYGKLAELTAQSPYVGNLLLSYFQGISLPFLVELYEKLEEIIRDFPIE